MNDPTGKSSLDARRRWLTILACVVAVGAIVFGLYWYFIASRYQRTDDAYVGGDVVAITGREPGTILALYADNTQRVTRGQVIAELDPVKANAAVDQARVAGPHRLRTKAQPFHHPRPEPFDQPIGAQNIEHARHIWGGQPLTLSLSHWERERPNNGHYRTPSPMGRWLG